MSRITAIIPAWNEAPRLGAVLPVITSYPGFSEVIVVDDGSEDETSEIAKKYQVRLIQHEENLGKGAAMDHAVQEANGSILFFADADTEGLTHGMIDEILSPVIEGRKEMCIGMHNRKIYAARIVLSMIPLVGGERALTKKLWQRLPPYYKNRFRIEPALNFFAKYFGRGYTYVVLSGITRIKKEQKYGLQDGFIRRLGMYRDQVVAEFHLSLHEIPPTPENQRHEVLSFLGSLFGFFIGTVIVVFFRSPLLLTLAQIIVVSNLLFAVLKLKRIFDLFITE